MEVLGLFGAAGSGKDLVADWFVEKKGFVKIAFADPMKRFAMQAFSIDFAHLWGPSEVRNEVFPVDHNWWINAIGKTGDACGELVRDVLEVGNRTTGYLKLMDWLTNLRRTYETQISARVILQTLGTEWGRDIDESMWVRYAYQTIEKVAAGNEYTQAGGLLETELYMKYDGVIIPDHRFKNEVECSQEKGTSVLRLRRLANEKSEDVGISGHRSEQDQKDLPDSAFDQVFRFEEGVDKVYAVLEDAYTRKTWLGHTQARS